MSLEDIRDAITMRFENNGLLKNKFYYDGKINIGYGFNITGNINTARDALDDVGIHISQTDWDSIVVPNATNPSSSSLAAINSQLNITIDPSQAKTLMDNYYNGVVIELKSHVPNLLSLPDTLQAALEDMYYHHSTLLGPITYGAANNPTPSNLAKVAEQLAFNADAAPDTNQPGLENRYLADAMLALGMIPSFNAHNQIIGLDTSGANLQSIQAFLSATLPTNNTLGSQGVSAQTYVNSWGTDSVETPLSSYNTIIKQLEGYLIDNGQYVVQPNETTFSKVFNDIKAIDGSVQFTAQDIEILNNGTSFTPGTVLQVRAATEADFGNIEPSEGPNPSAGWTLLEGTPMPGVRPDGSIEVFYTADTNWQPNPVLIGADTATAQVFNPATGMMDNVTGPAYNVLSVVYNGQPVNDLSGGAAFLMAA